MKLRLVLAMAVLLSGMIIAKAQTGTAEPVKDSCKASDLVGQLAGMKSAGDQTQDMAQLTALADKISAARIDCYGLTFKGQGAKVTDPVLLKQGTYRVKATLPTNGYSRVAVKGVAGTSCFAAVENSNAETTLEVYDDAGCKAVLEVKIDNKLDWLVTLELLQ